MLEEEQQKKGPGEGGDCVEGPYQKVTYESFVHSLSRGENDDFLKPVIELLVRVCSTASCIVRSA